MCAQSRVGWKQVHAGAKGVNVIVAAQEDLWPEMCENSRRRSGGAAAASAAADLRHVNILPPLRSVMRIQCSGESSRLAEARRRRRRRRSRKKKSNPARVHKVISSSGIKQTKQSYTSCNLSDCLHARTFLSTSPPPPTPPPHTHTPQCLWVWQGGLSGVKH